MHKTCKTHQTCKKGTKKGSRCLTKHAKAKSSTHRNSAGMLAAISRGKEEWYCGYDGIMGGGIMGGLGEWAQFYFWFHSARERFAGEIALVVRW